MSYAYYATKGKVYVGNDFSVSAEDIPSPYNYLSVEQKNLYNTNAPFSMTIIVVDPESDEPYQMTVLSPDYYMFVKLNEEEYRQFVLNRGQHMHNTYEIVYVREGEFFQQIEAQRYKFTSRSCCILNRNIRHKEEYTTAFSTVTLSLSPEFLNDLFTGSFDSFFFSETPSDEQSNEIRQFFDTAMHEPDQERKSYLNFVPTYEVAADNDFIHEIFDKLAQYIVSPTPGCGYLFRGLICQMLYRLSNQEHYSTNLINLGTEAESKLFFKITHLMEKNYGRISREELTKQLNYSGNYLNKIVKKYTGMNISEYGFTFSMQRAAWLLKHTDETIYQIALDLGFTDRTHFYRLFKKEFGETPKEYRNRQR